MRAWADGSSCRATARRATVRPCRFSSSSRLVREGGGGRGGGGEKREKGGVREGGGEREREREKKGKKGESGIQYECVNNSVCVGGGAGPNDPRLGPARNGLKRLKMLRHPNVIKASLRVLLAWLLLLLFFLLLLLLLLLAWAPSRFWGGEEYAPPCKLLATLIIGMEQFIDGLEIERGLSGKEPGPVVFLVTEPVVPLVDKLEQLALSAKEKEEYFAFGLHHITRAVSFLANDCRMVRNCLHCQANEQDFPLYLLCVAIPCGMRFTQDKINQEKKNKGIFVPGPAFSLFSLSLSPSPIELSAVPWTSM